MTKQANGQKVPPAPDWRPPSDTATAAQVRRAGLMMTEVGLPGPYCESTRIVLAPEVCGLSHLPREVREAGVIYGAIEQEIASPGVVTTLGTAVQGGRWGGGGAVDRRLTMVALRDRALAVFARLDPMEPQRRARKARGEMTAAGPVHKARSNGGARIDGRRPILPARLAWLLCVEGMSFRAILAAHGWEESARARERIRRHAENLLQALADEWNGDERQLVGYG